MTKIDIFSGFLGAGKTTLIKKLIKEAYCGEKLVLIENEFGEIGIDGGFLKDAGIEITEMNSGCICCSLVGNFSEALGQVLEKFAPDRIVIEPSGVGKLSDVIRAVQSVGSDKIVLGSFTAVVDALKCKMYMKNFGEFYNNQIENASAIIFSRTDSISEQKIADAVKLVREHNKDAVIVTTPWDKIDGGKLLETIENKHTLEDELAELKHEHEHHHHHAHDEECHCHEHEHHHDHDEECHCHEHGHEHHHHDHVEECHCHEHEHEHHHHHDHDEECHCDDHVHHHHADEVFSSYGAETAHKYTVDEIRVILNELDSGKYGVILRAKGIVDSKDGDFIHFDYVPGEQNVRMGAADVIGRICVIGFEMKNDELAKLFMIV